MSGERDLLDYAQKLGPMLSAVASTGAAIVALIVAFRGRRKARSEQAQRVTAWFDGEDDDGDETAPENELRASVEIGNASQQVAYDLVLRIVQVPNAPGIRAIPEFQESQIVDAAYIRAVPPGGRSVSVKFPDSGMHKRWGVEFAFQDAAGIYWYRSATGWLTEISKHPVDFFGMSWPVGWGR
jgi:hypothetical protein